MGLVEKVIEGRVVGRKSGFIEPNFWDVEQLRFRLFGSSSWTGEREQIENDFEGYVNGIYKRNGPVFALMAARLMVFSEARFMFRRFRNSRPGDLFGNADLALLQKPWRNGTTGDLLARMIQDADLAGNAYLTVVNGHIRRMRPDWVTVISGSQSEPELFGGALDAEVIAYMYEPRGREARGATLLLPEQVAHFAPMPDPDANWRGMSWLSPVLREISADSAATLHKLKFFGNGASPQIIVKVDPSLSPEKFARFKALMDEEHKGVDNAYKTLYIGGGADVTTAGMDLKQLDFKATQGAGETRLAAAARVPAVIVGFSEGLQGSSLNAGNFNAARRLFVDGTLRPLWRNAAGSLAPLVNVPSDAELWYDDRDIAFLREDAKDAAEIFNIEANTITSLVREGYEPESAQAAVAARDSSLLVHTGRVSVQLWDPAELPARQAQPAIEPPTGGQ